MPRQYEVEKRRIDRQSADGGITDDDQTGSSAQPTLPENQHGTETNERRIRKAMVTTFLNVQDKLQKQTAFDCSLSGSTLVAVY